MNHLVIIGIDPGTNTGFAVWDKPGRKLITIETLMIHEAMQRVDHYHEQWKDLLFVRFEDARLRTFFGEKGREALQGAGSIRRDCKIWEDFLRHRGISYASMAPKLGVTKLDPVRFKLWTGWEGRTSNHGRDAAMLIYGS